MAGNRVKTLLVLIAFDVFIAVMLGSASRSQGALVVWLFLNAIVIVLAILIRHYISKSRKVRARRKERKWEKHRGYSKSLRRYRRPQHGESKEEQVASGYGIRSLTLKGEIVSSKKEKIIADYFYQNGIQYQYEKPIFADEYYSKAMFPDFYLTDYHVYVEYWGLVNAEDDLVRESYNRGRNEKMRTYSERNIRIISLYEHDLHDLHSVFTAKLKAIMRHDNRENQGRLF